MQNIQLLEALADISVQCAPISMLSGSDGTPPGLKVINIVHMAPKIIC